MSGFPPGRVNFGPQTIGSGLAALLQGFVQGKELGLQNRVTQQQLQDDQTRNATNLLPLYQQMARLGVNIDPSKANAMLSPLGINLGNQVPKNFGAIDPAELVNNPESLVALQQLSPEMKGVLRPLLGGVLPDSFFTAPAQPTPTQALSAINDLREQYQPYAMGWLDPKSPQAQALQQQIAQMEQYVPGLAQTKAPATAAPGGPQVGYRGENVIARTQLTNAQEQKTIAETKWITPLNTARIGLIGAQKFYFDQQGAAIPVKLAQGWAKISVDQQNADTRAGELTNAIHRTMIEAKNADTNATKTANDAYNKSLIQIRADEALKKGYATQMSIMQQANPNADLSQNQSYLQLQANYKRVNDRLANEQQFAKNYPALVKSIGTRVLHKQGAPSSYQTTNAGNTDAGLSSAIAALKKMPRAQALQAIATARNYTPAEKAQLRASLGP